MRKPKLKKPSYLPKMIQLLSQGKDADPGLSNSKARDLNHCAIQPQKEDMVWCPSI